VEFPFFFSLNQSEKSLIHPDVRWKIL